MLIKEAKRLACEWTAQYARDHEILGAYFNGSVIEMEDHATLPASSDVDINLVVDGREPAEKPGKLLYQNVLLEASFIQKDSLFPAEKLLGTYEIVGAFRKDNIILDESGQLQALLETVSSEFTEPCWVRARMKAVAEKIERVSGGFDMRGPLLQNLNPWLFSAGICTHLLMVGALVNPTVRLRYLKLRPVLLDNGCGDLYEKLLELLGCRNFTAQQTAEHLKELAVTFDRTCPHAPGTSFPFSNDIGPHARAVVIDGSEELIRQGNHREAVFWMAATFVRCHLILQQTDEEAHQDRLPAMLRMFGDMGADSNDRLAGKIEQMRQMLPELQAAAETLYQKQCLGTAQ